MKKRLVYVLVIISALTLAACNSRASDEAKRQAAAENDRLQAELEELFDASYSSAQVGDIIKFAGLD